MTVPARVTCLNVNGNRAVIGTDTLDPGPGDRLRLVEDNNGAGSDRLDVFVFPDFVTVCPSFLTSSLACPDLSGNLVVHDTQPLPTSKDQCKNGGWRNFGSTFTNQGQCMSFVATGGKKQP